jgi:hypothetical protein
VIDWLRDTGTPWFFFTLSNVSVFLGVCHVGVLSDVVMVGRHTSTVYKQTGCNMFQCNASWMTEPHAKTVLRAVCVGKTHMGPHVD